MSAVLLECFGIVFSIDAYHQSKASSATRLDTGNRILDNHSALWFGAKLFGGCKKGIGFWFTRQLHFDGHFSIDPGIE